MDESNSTPASAPTLLNLDDHLLLSSLVEALELLLQLQTNLLRERVPHEDLRLVAQIRVRMAYLLAHSDLPPSKHWELSQLAARHEELAKSLLLATDPDFHRRLLSS